MADALAAHHLYAGRGAGAVEIAMPTQAALAHAVSGSVGWGVPVPDLSSLGQQPLGGRVLPSEDGVAALVIYENDECLRLSVFIRRSRCEGPSAPVITEREAPLRGAVWFRDGFGQAVVGTDAPASLLLSAAASLGG